MHFGQLFSPPFAHVALWHCRLLAAKKEVMMRNGKLLGVPGQVERSFMTGKSRMEIIKAGQSAVFFSLSFSNVSSFILGNKKQTS